MMRSKKGAVWAASACAFVLAVGMVACAPDADKDSKAEGGTAEGPAAVATASEFAEKYPNQYNSYNRSDYNRSH